MSELGTVLLVNWQDVCLLQMLHTWSFRERADGRHPARPPCSMESTLVATYLDVAVSDLDIGDCYLSRDTLTRFCQ